MVKEGNVMKFGMRTPSLKKSISARTKGRLTRQVKRALIPGYGKRGMGWLHPKRAIYNRVYHRTTFGVGDVVRASSEMKTLRTGSASSGHEDRRDERRQQLRVRIAALSETERQEVDAYIQARMPKKKTAYLVCLFTGLLGGHRYYLKSYASGILMTLFLLIFPLFTAAWWIVDLIRLSNMIDDRIFTMTDDMVTRIEKRHIQAVQTATPQHAATNGMDAPEATVSSVPVEAWYPADTEKFQRNGDETAFLRQLYCQVKEAGLSPNGMEICRLSDGTLKFTYDAQEIGRVRLQKRKHTMTYWQDGTEFHIEGELSDFQPYLPQWIGKIIS